MTTHIINVVDRSGSMASIKASTIMGYNDFMNRQREVPGDTRVTTLLFDDRIEMLCRNIPIERAPAMNSMNFAPRGYTALRDAVGYAIDDVGRGIPEGDSVIVCVLTDGHENRSRKYSAEHLRDRVAAAERNGWTFIYLAANVDAYETGAGYGFQAQNTYSFAATAVGTATAFADMSRAAIAARMIP